MDAIYEIGEFSGFVEYLDFESITVTDSGTLIVEEIQDLKESRSTKSGKPYLSMRIRAEYDMAKHLRRTHIMQALNESSATTRRSRATCSSRRSSRKPGGPDR